MKKRLAILAGGVASVASAQEWQFELSNPVLSPGSASTTVTASIDQGPGAFAVAAASLNIHSTEEGWSDLVALLSRWTPPVPGQNPGTISGGSVTGIGAGQPLGWLPIPGYPRPGRIEVWQATFTVTDFTARRIELSTETSRLDVFLDDITFTRVIRTPAEGSAIIHIIPAPAGLVPLGLGGLALARRRR